jgi:hypothetical protein
MRRKKASKSGRAIPILAAAGVGYLIGAWNAEAVRSKEPSGAPTAAQTVALRFPQAMSKVPVVQAAAYEQPVTATAVATDSAELALFEPEPMAVHPAAGPQAPAEPTAPQPAAQPAPWQTADISSQPAVPRAAGVAAATAAMPSEPATAPKPHPVLARRRVERPGYMLDDAQIASIKRRLHLTPDQERMWPAVEAALRTIGSEREREARGGHAPGTINPDSPEVQDLKSAAIPLLMSFTDEQKDEVRNLARGMGLNQLASDF